jgi:TonB family protein
MSRHDWRNSNHSQFSRLWGPGRRSDFTGSGLFLSFLFHCFILLPMVTVWNPGEVSEVQTYSVSIVAGSQLGGPRARLDQRAMSKVAEQRKPSTDPREPVQKRPALEKDETPIVKLPSPVPTVIATATPVPATSVPTKAPEPTRKPEPTKVPPTKVPPTRVPTGVPTRARPTATIARPTVTPRPTATEVSKRTATPTATPGSAKLPVEEDDGYRDDGTEPQAGESARDEVTKKDRTGKESGRQEYDKLMERYLGEEAAGSGDQAPGAQKLGGAGTGGDEQRPPEYFSYVERMRAEIDRRWVWHLRHEGLRTHIKMRIAEDGSIEFAEIAKGSGNLEFDRSVMRAIQAADPLPAPPPSVYRYFEDIIVIFDPNE